MRRPAELRRIVYIRLAPPRVAQAARSRLTAMATEGELPDVCSTNDIRAARDQRAFQNPICFAVMCIMQLATKKGKALDVEIVDPISAFALSGEVCWVARLPGESTSEDCQLG
eukprot:1071346-Pyramimonas_sp.AAC.2